MQNSGINFKSLDSAWYTPFFQLITENCGRNDLGERFKSITLIIFNYDRCIEHFMYHSLQKYYGFSEGEAAELVNNIRIYHPYGNVGALPWANQNEAMEFGGEPNHRQLLGLSYMIKTFTEGTDPKSSEIIEIRKNMSQADRIVFLGFAFHKLNMQLITPEYAQNVPKKPMKECFSTGHGISESDAAIIVDQIKELFRKELAVAIRDLTCFELFKEYWRSLSF